MCFLPSPFISILGERNLPFEGLFNWARRKYKTKMQGRVSDEGGRCRPHGRENHSQGESLSTLEMPLGHRINFPSNEKS